ncbi:MAG: histidine kinase, partial [Actinomycetota bacterium]
MNAESSTWLGRVLNLVGALAVGFYFTRLVIEGLPEWTVLLGSASLLAWLVVLFLPRRLLLATGLLFAVMGVAGALVAVPTAGLMVVPPAIGVLRLLADPRRALWQGVAAWLAGAGLVAAGVFFNDLPPYALLTIEGGLLIAALGGYSRRQYRESEERMRALAEEHARAVVQEHRQSVAREIHDVLAHSLGGLVVQLDAVGALLEAGRTGEATARVTDARALAVAGLTEAKRAVEALREDLPIEAVDLPGAIDDLVRAHRSLGGETDLIVEGVPHSLSAAASVAIAMLIVVVVPLICPSLSRTVTV